MRRVLPALVLLAAVVIAGAATARHPRPAAAAPVTAPAATLTRYSLVHGCYAMKMASGRTLGPFRMQATALARYLLYDGKFLSSNLNRVATPSPSTTWIVSRHFTLTNAGTGRTLSVTFQRSGGCPGYPEAQVNANGPTFRGNTPQETVFGTIDAHTHITAFEFLGGDWHCGKPWDRFGAPYALPDCRPYEQGSNGLVESFLDYGQPAHPHDTRGWPTFRAWPGPTDLAEEGDYWTGIERAWKAGVRIIVTQLVDNEALCTIMTKRHNPCNDTESVEIQARDLRALQAYIDAQSGGPGKGFFRIVTNPFQARQVINQGKLAVVEGIEVSHVLNCGEYLGVPQCSTRQINSELTEIRRLGVSTFFPIHKFDNAFGGTKMDGGETGVLVNGGNHLETGNFWAVKTCTGAEHDSDQITVPGFAPFGALADLINGPAAKLFGGAPLPVYPPPPHCNQRGLQSLGRYLIDQMVKRHFIVELDHMDAKTADSVLSLLERRHYSGVISAHSWDSSQENPRIYNLGGFVTPIANTPQSYVSDWRASRKIRDGRFYAGSGFGYGADMNGLHAESGPTNGTPITYPFKSFDGRVTFTRERWGARVFDINKDGVANYGMFPDWMQSISKLGGPQVVGDMFKGAEAYLEMWERAYGVRPSACHAWTVTPVAAGPIHAGESWQSVLYAAGQPGSRTGGVFSYCLTGGGAAQVHFDPSGRVSRLSH